MNVKDYIHIALLVIVVAALGICIHGYRERTDKIGTDIRRIEQQQSRVTEQLESIGVGLADAKKSVDTIQSRIDSATSTVDAITERNSDSAERIKDRAGLIAEGKEICKQIRERK